MFEYFHEQLLITGDGIQVSLNVSFVDKRLTNDETSNNDIHICTFNPF